MYDSDGSFTDSYLSGLSIVVLDERVIDIIEVLPVEQLHLETIGEPKQYELADTQQKLGKTEVISFLRPKLLV